MDDLLDHGSDRNDDVPPQTGATDTCECGHTILSHRRRIGDCCGSTRTKNAMVRCACPRYRAAG